MQTTFESQSHVGKTRKANEDSYGDELTPNGHIFVVCDGMGGHVGGAKASQLAVSSILEFFRNNKSDNLPALINDAINFANTQVHGHATEYPEFTGMGTTCVVMLITAENKVYYGHVGDSRIYQYTNGQLKKLTKDHSYVQFLVDTGEITEEEMETHPKKNQILKALGIDEEVKADVCQSPLIPEQDCLFLLCSDGLNGMVVDKDIKAHLDKFGTENLEETVAQLIENALENGGKDNVTATLIQYKAGLVAAKDDATQDLSKPAKTRVIPRNMLFMLFAGIIATVALVYAFTQYPTSNTKEEKKEEISDSTKKDTTKAGTVEKIIENKDTLSKEKTTPPKVENKKGTTTTDTSKHE
jgi:serine/threonine protein phosphatase PrpC